MGDNDISAHMNEKHGVNHNIENPQLIFSWKAPARAYKKKQSGVLRFYFALALLISVIVALFGDWILILPIAASGFLFYALTITPPGDIEYKITKFGVEINGVTYKYDNLSGFYITRKFDYCVITLLSNSPFFRHIYLVIDDNKITQKIVNILTDHIVYIEKPQKTAPEKIAHFLSNMLPYEDEVTVESQVKREGQTAKPL